MTLFALVFIFIVGSIAFFVFSLDTSIIGKSEKEKFLNYFSSVLSDMNVDYKDTKISPENIRNISTSIVNFTTQVEKLAPLAKKSDRETQEWFVGLIDEFHGALSLWTERHADEIESYEKGLSLDTPTVSLIKIRLSSQSNALRKIIGESGTDTTPALSAVGSPLILQEQLSTTNTTEVSGREVPLEETGGTTETMIDTTQSSESSGDSGGADGTD